MDDDHLFVCSSQDALAVPNGTPPFHDEIKAFAANLNKTSFSEFYEGRFNWHWYPIVTNSVSSFSTHEDLLSELTKSAVLRAIGYAADICSREDGRRFISALGLLSLLCRSVDSPKTVPGLTNHFMAIRKRVTANTIDSNIGYWFSKVALYQLNSGAVPDGYEGSFDRAGLNAPEKHVVSKKRVADHGEVYTREREVTAMLDLVLQETQRIDSRFLDPACGTGNFLIEILTRKLKVVAGRYKRSQSDFERYAFQAVASLYGIDILHDNIETCRNRLFYLFDEQYSSLYQKKTKPGFQKVIRSLLKKNIIHGDALSLQTIEEQPQDIIFSEWSFVRGNQIKRRDFIFEKLSPDETNLPLFSATVPKSDQGKTVFIPTPVKDDYSLCHFMGIDDVA